MKKIIAIGASVVLFSLIAVLYVKADSQNVKNSLLSANFEILANTESYGDENCNQETYEDYVWDYNCSGVYNSYDDRAGYTRKDTFCSGNYDSVDTPCWSGVEIEERDCFGRVIRKEIITYDTHC
jgi:hypothetical protein